MDRKPTQYIPRCDWFSWLVCHNCGWELMGAANPHTCGECDKGDLHIHSNKDGELPKRLPRHNNLCSDQNVLAPNGAYLGAEKCCCQKWSLR